MKYGIVLFPNKEIQDTANAYRKRYDPHYALIPPHLTLKEEFEMSEVLLQKVITELSRVASHIEPFQLTIHKVSHFHPTNNVIYLAIKDEPKLMELQQQLHEPELLQHERSYDFVPHITIGQEMSDDELHDIHGRLRMKDTHFTFPVDRFHLVYQLDNLTWNVHQPFVLGGKG